MTPNLQDARPSRAPMLQQLASFRGLLCDGQGNVVGFRGRHLVSSAPPFTAIRVLGGLNRLFHANHLRSVRRLLRLEIHRMVESPRGTLVCTSSQGILRKPRADWNFRSVFREYQGRRPLSLCQDADGRLYFGEYFSNPHRGAVRVFASDDDGQSWHVCFEFPAGAVRHVHGLEFDPYRNGIWVLTGDDGPEAQVGWATPEFRSYDIVWQRDQQSRVVSGVPTPAGLAFGTDAPHEQNFLYLLDAKSGVASPRAAVQHSVFYSGQAMGKYFFSTVVEPSRVHTTRSVHLWSMTEEGACQEILTLPRDHWPTRWFQYPSVFIAPGPLDGPYLVLSCTGTQGSDGDCLILTAPQTTR